MTEQRVDFTVVVPVGPTHVEVRRLVDLLESLARHEASERYAVVLVDDAPRPRHLHEVAPAAEIVRTELWRRGRPDALSAHVAGTIEAMRRAEGVLAVKLDTDALVVAPFFARLSASLRADPTIGLMGAVDQTPNGERRDWSRWPPIIQRSEGPIRFGMHSRGPIGVGWRSKRDRDYVKTVLRDARLNPGYEMGAHCLGGAYAVSAQLLTAAPTWRWRPWVGSGLGEDIVMGLLCGAHGLRLAGMAADGEPFGVSWRGLPDSPDRLLARGYALVHSVKDSPHGTESELRRWFRENA
jgi:hypothetical protein